MARIDKYDPTSGGFRAPLGFAPAAGDVGKVIPVDINNNGRAVKSADGTAARGVLCMSSRLNQGDPVDVMTDGEIVDVDTDDVTGAAAGVGVNAGAGVASAAAAGRNVGFMVEAWRLIVRMERGA